MTLMLADFGDYGPTLINDVVYKYIDAVNHGFGFLKGNVSFVLNVLVVISIVWSALLWTLSDDHVVAHFTRKIIFIGIFVWLVQAWPSLSDKLVHSFMDLGLRAGNFDSPNTYTSEPGNILYLCYTTIDPIIQQIVRMCSSWSFYKNLAQIILLSLSVAAIVAAFFAITIQVAMTLLTFKMGSLVTFILVPFGVLSKTAFIAERPLGWVVGSGIRLMVLTLVLGIANGIFNQLAPPARTPISIYDAFTIALASLLLMMFSFVASKLATDMIIGGPSLGVGTAVNQAAVAYNTASGTVTRPAYVAAKAAAALPTKGVPLALDASRSVVNAAARSFIRAPGGQPTPIFPKRQAASA